MYAIISEKEISGYNMNLYFNTALSASYHGKTQIARVLTESWVAENMYCPRCGHLHILHFPNNRPVADFFCPKCKNEYELKSKAGPIDKKINDGAYASMIERITSYKNPDFLFMNYSKENQSVKDLIFIPKHFFVPDIIERRKPLANSARRAGWIGCNILLDKVPIQGRIHIVKNGTPIDKDSVIQKVASSQLLKFDNIRTRGWVFDVLNCINQIPTESFSLSEIYSFADNLSAKHPQNNNIEAKIRQQLQALRDLGFISFLGRGKYKKLQ